jgi:hypothetical protein
MNKADKPKQKRKQVNTYAARIGRRFEKALRTSKSQPM